MKSTAWFDSESSFAQEVRIIMFRMFTTASHSSKHFAYKKCIQPINIPEIVFSATLGEDREAQRG